MNASATSYSAFSAGKDVLADRVIDRLVRKLSEGEQIGSIEAYLFDVAHYILLEELQARRRTTGLQSVPVQVVDPTEMGGDEERDEIDRCQEAHRHGVSAKRHGAQDRQNDETDCQGES